DEKTAAETAVKKLEDERPQRDSQRARLERAERAAKLSDAVANRDERRKEAKEAAGQLSSAEAMLGAAATELKQARSDMDREERREPEREAERAKLQRLRSLEPQVTKLMKATETLAEAEAKVLAAAEARRKAHRAATKAEKELEEAKKQHEIASVEAAKLAGLEAQIKNAEKTIKVVQRLKEARKQQAAAERAAKSAAAALAEAEAAHEKARKQLDKAREERLRGIAAELAASLVDGEPCPVCGSTEHPSPAQPARGIATADKIAALEKQAAEAEKALKAAQRDESKAQSAVAAAAKEVETLEKSLEKAAAGVSVTRLESQLKKQQDALGRAQKAAGSVREIRGTIQALTRGLQQARARLDAATKDEASAQKKAASARAQVNELEAQVEKPLRAAGALEKAIARQEKILKQLDAALQAARDRLARAEKQHAGCEQKVKSAKAERDKREAAAVKAQAELEQRLKKAGFANEKDYQASIMSTRDMEKLAGELRRYDEAIVAARDRLQKATEAAKGLKAPNLPSLRAACDEARQAIQNCDTRIGSLRTALKQLADVTKKLDEITKRLAAREREHQRVQRLADLASGRAPANPGFHRFVLGYRLDEVLMHANGRLATMSGGRYRLQRKTEARGKRELQAGLNLEVKDGYSGKVRPVETLSGGETFVAALALALGLSDAVQSLAGGIRLDTVFIDEGFGSLDSDALDRAMEALMLLREGGRLVGIISHVAELRERIRNTRLEVTTTHGASHARLVLA
ncbi:MAG: hypothetical protein N2111_10585, partial [Candidatus Sumerlaeaceae bacterium]|nr:hypothetical protein [Candidatus Sumerlaeaceae bacterium]